MFINRLSPGFRALILLALALALILPGLGHRHITTSHEARVVQTARAMSESGTPWNATLATVPAMELREINGMKRMRPTENKPPMQVNPWLVPVMSGEMRLQKPPLPYWLAAICFQLFGYDEASGRLNSALMTALASLLIFDLGRLLLGKRAGWYAALAWISLYFIYDEHRRAMADPALAFFCLAAVWAWVRASLRISRGGLGFLLLSYLAMALGALAKGPLIFLHVSIALTAIHWCCRLRLPGRWWQHLIGIALFALVALPWPIYVLQHVPNAMELWKYESLNEEKARELYFYLPQLFYIALPWTGVWLYEVVMAIGRWKSSDSPAILRRSRRELSPIVWLLAVVVVMSAAPVKKNAYLLPEIPAIALCIGAGLRRLVAGLRIPSQQLLARVLVIGTVVAGAIAGLMIWPLHKAAYNPPHWPKETIAWATLAAGSIAVAVIFAAIPTLALLKRWRQTHWPTAQAAVLAVAATLIFSFVFTPSDNRRSAKATCAEAMSLLKHGHYTLATNNLAEEVTPYLPLHPESAIPPESRFATRVLLIRDDADGVEARRRKLPDKPFNPIGTRVDGAEVTAFKRLPVPGNRGDVRWQLWELTVTRTAVAAK
jgi:4-amino-4-deoxy-L-arabinose transferase-like glycosyltransferase